VLHARCRILPLVALAVDDAKAATARHILETCGNRVVEEMKVNFEGDLEIVLPMIPEHLYMITSEIIANALRVTAQRHTRTLGPHSTCLPPVTVTFSRGPDQFYLKISDRGGGVPFDDIQKIWKFSYSGTSLPPTRAVSTDSVSTKTRVSQQGLSLSRLYARYWGGDITMASMENWGCDFLLRIPLVAHPGVQLILPDAMHDDPLSRGGCYKERCSYPYPYWKDQAAATATDGTSLFTAPL
jgi:signal transduction histidine kinase